MGLFSRKPKVSIEDFCQDFYDRHIFHCPSNLVLPSGKGLWEVYLETTYKGLVQADQSFSTVDPMLFHHEATALRTELFGLACQHHLKKDEYALQQAIFTWSYLEQKGKINIWETMLHYNEGIAISTLDIAKSKGEEAYGARATYLSASRGGRAMWMEAGVDAECATRVANRWDSEEALRQGITFKRLASRLAVRLECDPNLNSQALILLGGFVYGLYNGAKEAIKSVKLQVA